jgi:hypothetical protein
MAYIGREPQIGNFQICDAISTVNNQAAYTMQVSSVDVLPESANHMIVSLNGVIQKPNSSYTVSGATITFASNLVTGDVINFIQILGSVLDLGVPSDDTVTAAKLSSNAVTTAKILDANVTTAKITDNAITLAKLASGTDGNIISYDTSGNPVAVATGNDGQVLTSAGAGAVPTFETLPVSGITVADQWRLTTSFTGDASPIATNLERVDTSGWGILGTGMSQSSGIFTFPSTGIWFVKFRINNVYNGENRYATASIQVTTNNSSYANIASGEQGITNASANVYSNTLVETLIDCTNTSNVKVRFNIDVEDASATTNGNQDVSYTNMMFIRLGDT